MLSHRSCVHMFLTHSMHVKECHRLFVKGKGITGGYLSWKGLQGCTVGKTPFSLSLRHSTRPPFQHFSVTQTSHLNPKSQNFPIFCSKCLNFGKFSVLKLKNWLKSSSGSLIWAKKSVLKAAFLSKKKNQFSKPHSLNLAPIYFTSLHFWPFGLLTHTQNWVPPITPVCWPYVKVPSSTPGPQENHSLSVCSRARRK